MKIQRRRAVGRRTTRNPVMLHTAPTVPSILHGECRLPPVCDTVGLENSPGPSLQKQMVRGRSFCLFVWLFFFYEGICFYWVNFRRKTSYMSSRLSGFGFSVLLKLCKSLCTLVFFFPCYHNHVAGRDIRQRSCFPLRMLWVGQGPEYIWPHLSVLEAIRPTSLTFDGIFRFFIFSIFFIFEFLLPLCS